MSNMKKLDAETVKLISHEFFDAVYLDLQLEGRVDFAQNSPHLLEFSEWLHRLEETLDV